MWLGRMPRREERRMPLAHGATGVRSASSEETDGSCTQVQPALSAAD